MMREHGDSLEKLGAWYDDGTLEWTVPSYVEGIDSIADLRGRADMFGGTITGIDPNAGITSISKDEVIPSYGLGDSYQLRESSSSAMTFALERAIAERNPIVVTLWHPHVAYTKYDLKDLEDPKGALGAGDELWMLARENFGADAPEVAKWLTNFALEPEQLRSLEDLMFNQFPDNRDRAIDEWLADNQSLVNDWMG